MAEWREEMTEVQSGILLGFVVGGVFCLLAIIWQLTQIIELMGG